MRSDLSDAVRTLHASGLRAVAREQPEVFIRNHRGLEALEAATRELPRDPDFAPKPWQNRVLGRLQARADDRTIIWVRDSQGGKGKSRLARHLVLEKGAVILSGRLEDMAYLYKREPIVIFDVSRAAQEHSDHLYTMAEKLKDGMMVSTKYQSEMKVFSPPHVIFFANIMPNEMKWSQDRVKLIDLDMEGPIDAFIETVFIE